MNINLQFVAVGTGTVDAITATYAPVPLALMDRMMVLFRATGANTITTPTFNPNDLGAKVIVKKGGVALAVGDITGAGFVGHLVYDATNDRWELLNPGASSGGGGGVTSVSGTSPIASTGGATPDISIADAIADGATKGAASFTASDFNSASGVIAIDYTNGQASSLSNKGFLTSADFTIFNGKQDALSSGVNIKTVQSTSIVGSGDVTITDANLSTSDITTNDVTTSKHGFVPKAPNDTTKFLRGDATWDVPTFTDPSGWTTIVKSANQDVTNSATLTDDTDLQFSVVAGGYYMLELDLVISANTTAGDYKFAFNVSAGTIKGLGIVTNNTVGGAVQIINISALSVATTTSIGSGTLSSDLDYLISIKTIYSFTASDNATFKYQFANNQLGAGRISRTWKGSILKYKRID
jgi:hypothetical protein